jgi:hypothetical protein
VSIVGNYIIVDRTPRFIHFDAGPEYFVDFRLSSVLKPDLAYFEMWLKTSYATAEPQTHARLVLNGTQIDTIKPAGLAHPLGFEVSIFPFDSSILRTVGLAGQYNQLRIPPPPIPDHVIIAKILLHFHV